MDIEHGTAVGCTAKIRHNQTMCKMTVKLLIKIDSRKINQDLFKQLIYLLRLFDP